LLTFLFIYAIVDKKTSINCPQYYVAIPDCKGLCISLGIVWNGLFRDTGFSCRY